ncbi:hypothetical protein BGZ82_010579 [Podila clonocystis]|nr:hypothetical protein BGZ82_010579 [Podila clonocystis]
MVLLLFAVPLSKNWLGIHYWQPAPQEDLPVELEYLPYEDFKDRFQQLSKIARPEYPTYWPSVAAFLVLAGITAAVTWGISKSGHNLGTMAQGACFILPILIVIWIKIRKETKARARKRVYNTLRANSRRQSYGSRRESVISTSSTPPRSPTRDDGHNEPGRRPRTPIWASFVETFKGLWCCVCFFKERKYWLIEISIRNCQVDEYALMVPSPVYSYESGSEDSEDEGRDGHDSDGDDDGNGDDDRGEDMLNRSEIVVVVSQPEDPTSSSTSSGSSSTSPSTAMAMVRPSEAAASVLGPSSEDCSLEQLAQTISANSSSTSLSLDPKKLIDVHVRG